MKAPLAIVTMVYNEAVLLPVWLRHHGAQAGTENCFVLDHGSSDDSTRLLELAGASRIRIPRSPQDDGRRCGFVSDFCASLLNWYDTVIYTDVDELLVADPARFDSLVAYTSSLAEDAVVTAAGVDVVHVPDQEARLDWNQPVSTQRSWLRFSSAMCKPVAIRRRVAWAPGFHCIDDAPCFGELFLFHLRYADLQAGLDRLQRTRRQPWITPEAGSHQRMPDASWETMLRQMAGLPRRRGVELSLIQDPLAHWIALVRDSAETRRDELYRIDLHLSGDELWQLPDRFRGRF